MVLEDAGFAGDWSGGLDPANAGGGSISQYGAIFGGLFLLRADKDGSNTRLTPYQASSGKLSPDAKTLTIRLRPGIKFSDGTPMNAKAVIWNFQRDTGATCTRAPDWKLRKNNPFTSPDPLTVVSNQLSSKLVLKRNPNFFVKGQPYLDGLTMKSIGGDQPAYQALLAGQADARRCCPRR